ncbi:unnamed protein product [Arabidopsis arenosa]|uniref:Peptidase S8/S53 domain-containing protein n=1 Tax=Arabidopsis arenosa TaxID=38785 RepID=A0A8S2AFP0_ARAAE|nr:unnamed protein product [Arabidopsis arenosa]
MGLINHSDDEFRSPRDRLGHGVARGMSPQARIAMYKACWRGGFCVSFDVLAAIDKAIEDNVNILSLSLALNKLEYDKDIIAIGALAAIERGIFVVAVAGNDGPNHVSLFLLVLSPSTMQNE